MTVGVIGAGAMGTGIAQVAAAAGHRVIIADSAAGATSKAQQNITKAMERDVEKGRATRDAADAAVSRIEFRDRPLENDFGTYASCGLVIEAIVEDLTTKQAVFRRLERAV